MAAKDRDGMAAIEYNKTNMTVMEELMQHIFMIYACPL